MMRLPLWARGWILYLCPIIGTTLFVHYILGGPWGLGVAGGFVSMFSAITGAPDEWLEEYPGEFREARGEDVDE